MCDIYHTRDGPKYAGVRIWSDPAVDSVPIEREICVLLESAIRDCNVPGPFHRVESPTQKVADALRQQQSNEIWGKPATGNAQSHLPCVKAYPSNCRLACVGLISTPLSVPLAVLVHRSKHDGIWEPQASCNELIRRERSMPQSRYLGS